MITDEAPGEGAGRPRRQSRARSDSFYGDDMILDDLVAIGTVSDPGPRAASPAPAPASGPVPRKTARLLTDLEAAQGAPSAPSPSGDDSAEEEREAEARLVAEERLRRERRELEEKRALASPPVAGVSKTREPRPKAGAPTFDLQVKLLLLGDGGT